MPQALPVTGQRHVQPRAPTPLAGVGRQGQLSTDPVAGELRGHHSRLPRPPGPSCPSTVRSGIIGRQARGSTVSGAARAPRARDAGMRTVAPPSAQLHLGGAAASPAAPPAGRACLADVEAEVALVGPVGNEHRGSGTHQGRPEGLLHALGPGGADPPRQRGPSPTGQPGSARPRCPPPARHRPRGRGSRRPRPHTTAAPLPPAAEARRSPRAAAGRRLDGAAGTPRHGRSPAVTTTLPASSAMPGTDHGARDWPSARDTTTGAPPLSTTVSGRRSRSSAVAASAPRPPAPPATGRPRTRPAAPGRRTGPAGAARSGPAAARRTASGSPGR